MVSDNVVRLLGPIGDVTFVEVGDPLLGLDFLKAELDVKGGLCM